jgi:HK97 family phage prohead protease
MSPTINGRIDLATGEYMPYKHATPTRHDSEPVERIVWVDPDAATHEAQHVAMGLLRSVRMTQARADNPSPNVAGHVLVPAYTPTRDKALLNLAGYMGEDGWPPDQIPSPEGATGDERQLAWYLDQLGYDLADYRALVADAKQIVATPQFKSLVGVIETLLERGLVLDKDRLQLIHKSLGGEQLEHKTLKAATRTETDLGQFTAIAAAYTLDRDKERIVPGAFEKSLAAWRKRNRPIPLHWSHLGDPQYIIGEVDPHTAREIREGLYVKGRVDIDHSDTAREAWRLVKSGTVGLSFGFLATKGPERSDGTRQIVEIDLFEISLTPAPANPDTRIISFKSTDRPDTDLEPEPVDPEQQRLRTEARDHFLNLLGAPLPPDAALEREHKRAMRELRRECDRIRLEAALGWDTELIKNLRSRKGT